MRGITPPCPPIEGEEILIQHRGSSIQDLELRVLRCSWEGDHVADVAHPCNEEDQPFKPKAKTAVRSSSKPACIEIPPDIFFLNIHLIDPPE